MKIIALILILAGPSWGGYVGVGAGTSASTPPFDPTGLAYSTNVVQKTGDTMSGQLTNTSSITVTGGNGLLVTYGTDAGSLTVRGQATVVGSATVIGNAFSVGASTFVVVGSSIGIRTASPGAALHVLGDGVFRDGITASSGSFTATGATQYSAVTSSGINVLNSAGVYAGFFVGSGAGLTNITASAGTVNTLTGTGTVTGGSLGLGGVNLSTHASGGLTVSSMSFTATGATVYGITVASGIALNAGRAILAPGAYVQYGDLTTSTMAYHINFATANFPATNFSETATDFNGCTGATATITPLWSGSDIFVDFALAPGHTVSGQNTRITILKNGALTNTGGAAYNCVAVIDSNGGFASFNCSHIEPNVTAGTALSFCMGFYGSQSGSGNRCDQHKCQVRVVEVNRR